MVETEPRRPGASFTAPSPSPSDSPTPDIYQRQSGIDEMINERTLIQMCEDLLSEKLVKYRKVTEGVLTQAPSSKLRDGACVFPGSKSKFNHVIFLSKGERNKLLLVSYSKILVFPSNDHERLYLKALDINSQTSLESPALWRTETKHGNAYPVLEMTVFPTAQGLDKEFIWKCCGSIDVAFKNRGEEFTGEVVSNSGEVARKVKDFLQNTGFKKIKETPIQGGVSYLVVLSNDDEDEDSPWKRFPMKIDVSDLLTFRVYFSLKDAAISASKGFINSSQRLMAECNWKFPVGFYNYAHLTHQMQFTLKLHYKALSAPDLSASLRSYYDSAILNYKWTVRAMAELHAKTSNGIKSASQVFEYMALLHEELQGEYVWTKIEYIQRDLECLRTLDRDGNVEKYFLPKPFYWYQSDSKRLYAKTSRRVLSIREFLDRFSDQRDEICSKLLELLVDFSRLNTYPTANMLFCSCDSPFRMIIIPQSGFHTDISQFFNDLLQFGLDRIRSLNSSGDLSKFKEADYLYIDRNQFCEVLTTSLDKIQLRKTKLAGDDYIFYQIDSQAKTLRFLILFEMYRSAIGTLPEYPNALVGWTDAYEEEMDDSMNQSSSTVDSFCFIIEKLDYKLWKGNDPLRKFLAIISKLQSLHSAGMFHWFLSPFTVRQHQRNDNVTLVLPGLREIYVDMVRAFLPKKSREYMAPEVREFVKRGKAVRDREKADVFSVCKLIHEAITISIPKSSTIPSINDLITFGLSTDPSVRPTLSQLNLALQELELFQRQ